MRYLLDSHVLLWGLSGSTLLKREVADIIAKADIHVSIASLWELKIKQDIGKLTLPPRFYERLAQANAHILPVELTHIQALSQLQKLHRDPFDRMLIAQALVERMTLITNDKLFAQYGGEILQA